jgi:hypothetical protein
MQYCMGGEPVPTLPTTNPLNYIGVFLLIGGLFLILTGLNIIKIEKITVAPGKNTLRFGILLLVFGFLFLMPEVLNTVVKIPSATTSPVGTDVNESVATNPQEITGTMAGIMTQTQSINVLVDTYHGEELLDGDHRKLFRDEGITFEFNDKAITKVQLKRYDIFIIVFAKYNEGTPAFDLSEIEAVREYIDEGGSVFLIGLAWVWTQIGHNRIGDFPLNLISDDFGIWFSEETVWDLTYDESPSFYPPFLNENHSITKNIKKLSAPKSLPGSLIIKPPAEALVWGDNNTRTDDTDSKHPIIMAATTAGKGKLVCLQHGAYVTNNSEENDNLKLLANTLHWLASK